MTDSYAEDIALGPDPDIEDTHDPENDDEEEVERLLAEAESGAQGDWNLKGEDDE